MNHVIYAHFSHRADALAAIAECRASFATRATVLPSGGAFRNERGVAQTGTDVRHGLLTGASTGGLGGLGAIALVELGGPSADLSTALFAIGAGAIIGLLSGTLGGLMNPRRVRHVSVETYADEAWNAARQIVRRHHGTSRSFAYHRATD